MQNLFSPKVPTRWFYSLTQEVFPNLEWTGGKISHEDTSGKASV